MAQTREDNRDATATLVQGFYAAHSQWSKHTLECYRSVLEAFRQDFSMAPADPVKVIAWMRGLESIYEGRRLKPATRQDYYERVRYFYRWAGLTELPYESFRRRSHKS
jgi:hypothetical protein